MTDERGRAISRTLLALGACPSREISALSTLQLEAVSGERMSSTMLVGRHDLLKAGYAKREAAVMQRMGTTTRVAERWYSRRSHRPVQAKLHSRCYRLGLISYARPDQAQSLTANAVFCLRAINEESHPHIRHLITGCHRGVAIHPSRRRITALGQRMRWSGADRTCRT